MKQRIHFLHHSPGRVRVSIDGLKGNQPLRDALEALAGQVRGIERITASTLTGSVLILYAPADSQALSNLQALMDESETWLDLICSHPEAVRKQLGSLGLAP